MTEFIVQYHTFRAFIECGATQVLDPVMDYFGGIQLTYGFCSPELTKHINGSIDPKRDQHAAHELNTRGNLICERKGAACDFIVPDENMLEVAQWIVQNTPSTACISTATPNRSTSATAKSIAA